MCGEVFRRGHTEQLVGKVVLTEASGQLMVTVMGV